jgi:hypothetical protein
MRRGAKAHCGLLQKNKRITWPRCVLPPARFEPLFFFLCPCMEYGILGVAIHRQSPLTETSGPAMKSSLAVRVGAVPGEVSESGVFVDTEVVGVVDGAMLFKTLPHYSPPTPRSHTIILPIIHGGWPEIPHPLSDRTWKTNQEQTSFTFDMDSGEASLDLRR